MDMIVDGESLVKRRYLPSCADSVYPIGGEITKRLEHVSNQRGAHLGERNRISRNPTHAMMGHPQLISLESWLQYT